MPLTSIPRVDGTRLRSYILHLPVFTRICIVLIIAFYVLGNVPALDVVNLTQLTPSKVGLSTMYRLNTYPFVHYNLLHAGFNLFALTPLMERFEVEHGTLLTAALFGGPLATLPAGLYLIWERGIMMRDTSVGGASIWVFLLLSSEAIKLWKANPYFDLAGIWKMPTWITPLILVILTNIFIPSTSFWGHLCGCAVGYLYGLGYLKILSPPEKVMRWLEGKLNLLGRIPHYVSLDQKTYGRYGVLPMSNGPSRSGQIPMTYTGSTQRLGP